MAAQIELARTGRHRVAQLVGRHLEDEIDRLPQLLGAGVGPPGASAPDQRSGDGQQTEQEGGGDEDEHACQYPHAP